MEGQARPTEHEIGLDYALVSTSLYAPHYPHITAFREELSRWHFYYLDPRVMREESSLKSVDVLGPFGQDLAALYHTLQVEQPQQFEALNRALRMLIPGIDGIRVERTEEGKLRLQILERGIPFSSRLISEGTLRILGLLAILNPTSPTTVVGYEEPENGVHPRRLQLIARLLENAVSTKRQILVNTHSPLLPDFLDLDHPDVRMLICHKEDGATLFREAPPLPLFRRDEVLSALHEGSSTSFSTRLVRGDFDE